MDRTLEEAQAGFELALVELAHKWRRVVDNMLRPKGLSQATWRTLFFVSQAGGEINQKELAFQVGIEGPSLVHLLDSLENDGLIERLVSTTDRRAKTIHLTSQGERQMKNIADILLTVRQELLANLTVEQLSATQDTFELIRDNAEAFGKDADAA